MNCAYISDRARVPAFTFEQFIFSWLCNLCCAQEKEKATVIFLFQIKEQKKKGNMPATISSSVGVFFLDVCRFFFERPYSLSGSSWCVSSLPGPVNATKSFSARYS